MALCRRGIGLLVPQDEFESEHINPLEEHLAAGEFGASLVPFQREIAGSHSRGDIRNGQLPSKPGLNLAFDYRMKI